MKTIRICPSCRKPLPVDAPAGLCPACLLQSQSPSVGGAPDTSSPPSPRLMPEPGQDFGGYRLHRQLGQGGMGEVFEAEQLATGRRVALKAMNHTLASEDDRKRFLREGRLAASVNHPNVVYVHGSEEIDGIPVIIMELVRAGTLKDRLKTGPLPVAEAVDAALQIIAGLEAAHSAGILHRDIKPANCFVDADGTVKVGDFGVSVSTLARGESLLTATGAVLGTPAYAPPEQLRGEELDARSDIYSVGATLYHLLTGQPPFPSTDFVKLITEVLDRPPVSPQAIRRDLPAALVRVVLRCLAKDRKARFQNYGELAGALLPFRKGEREPARPGRRFLSEMVDGFIVSAPVMAFLLFRGVTPLDEWVRDRTIVAALASLPFLLWSLAYRSVTEGLWGAGLGKMLCGLIVIGPDRHPPGLWRALGRATIFTAPEVLAALVTALFVSSTAVRDAMAADEMLPSDWIFFPLWAALFVTMRRRNGFAALHDLASGTRVVVRPRSESRPSLARLLKGRQWLHEAAPDVAKCLPPSGQFGPYEVQSSLWHREEEELVLAWDPALRRRIWIHLLRAEPSGRARRDLNRPGRLRWLNGGVTPDGRVWNAYDAPDGRPWLELTKTARPWSAVRFWLLDLATELAAALSSPSTATPFARDRIWIDSAGRAILLDFSCPGLPPAPASSLIESVADVRDLQRVLDGIARDSMHSERGSAPPPPVSARPFLDALAQGTLENPAFVVGNLESLAGRPAEVSRSGRLTSVLGPSAALLVLAAFVAAMVTMEDVRWERQWAAAYPGKPSLRVSAPVFLTMAAMHEVDILPVKDFADARAFMTHHYATLLTNETFWAGHGAALNLAEDEKKTLVDAVTEGASLTPVGASIAHDATLFVARAEEQRNQMRWVPLQILIGMILFGLFMMALLELAGAVLAGFSPLVRLFGMAIVDPDGRPAPRWRLLVRWLLTWPGVVGVIGMLGGLCLVSLLPAFDPVRELFGGKLSASGSLGAMILCLVTFFVLAIRPRSIPDRLAGTWLTPR